MSQPKLSSRIDKSSVCGPQAHDNLHRSATGRTEGDERYRVFDTRWLTIDALCLQDHPTEGVGRDGTAGIKKAEVANFHEAM